MPVAAVVAGTVVSAYGAKKAAKAQTRAGDQAIAEQQRQYQETQAQQTPFMQAGQEALGRLQNPQASFQASPGYNFVRSEGQRDIGNSFAARGGAASGNALRALTEFNQGLASQEFGNWWNQQSQLAGVGQGATNALGAFGARTADNIGRAQLMQGDARASGIEGVGNALLFGGEQGYGAWRQRQQPRSTFGYTPPRNNALKPGQGVMQAGAFDPWNRARRRS